MSQFAESLITIVKVINKPKSNLSRLWRKNGGQSWYTLSLRHKQSELKLCVRAWKGLMEHAALQTDPTDFTQLSDACIQWHNLVLPFLIGMNKGEQQQNHVGIINILWTTSLEVYFTEVDSKLFLYLLSNPDLLGKLKQQRPREELYLPSHLLSLLSNHPPSLDGFNHHENRVTGLWLWVMHINTL